MANINGQTIPGGVDWAGIGNSIYNTLQAPYDERTVGPLDTPQSSQVMGTVDAGGNYAPSGNYDGQFDSFASDNRTINGPSYYGPSAPVYSAAGSTVPNKDQSQLSPGQAGMQFAYTTPAAANPAGLSSWLAPYLAKPNAAVSRMPIMAAAAPAAAVAHAAPRVAPTAPRAVPTAVMPIMASAPQAPRTKIQQYQTDHPLASPSQAYNAVAAPAVQQSRNPNAVMAAITGNGGRGANAASSNSGNASPGVTPQTALTALQATSNPDPAMVQFYKMMGAR